LDAGNSSNDLFQMVTSLQDALPGKITPIVPKQIEQEKYNRRSRTFLPLLKQLETGYAILIQCDNLTI
jgi:hypothetical protein